MAYRADDSHHAITIQQKPNTDRRETCPDAQCASKDTLAVVQDDSLIPKSSVDYGETKGEIPALVQQEESRFHRKAEDSFKNPSYKKHSDPQLMASPESSAIAAPLLDSTSLSDVSILDDLNDIEQIHGHLREIPEEDIIDQVLSVRPMKEDDPPEGIDAQVLYTKSGTNNRVYIVQYTDGEKVCLRVPASGLQTDKWSIADANHLESTALCMRYISENTKFPMPKLITYDKTSDNYINAPYTMLSHIRGRSLKRLWWDKDGLLPLEERRQAILKSLATHMAGLRHFSFTTTGLLYSKASVTHPIIYSPISKTPVESTSIKSTQDTPKIETESDPSVKFINLADSPGHASSAEMFQHRLDSWLRTQERYWDEGEYLDMIEHARGTVRAYKLLIDYLPHPNRASDQAAQPPERFFISPPDNDLQNVLADEYGNITGFVDWDSVEALPDYLSWASLPIWLRVDWRDGYDWPSSRRRFNSPRELEKYRKQYEGYLRAACGGINGGATYFTEKTAIFQAVYEKLDEENPDAIWTKLMPLLLPRVETDVHFQRLGRSWAQGEEEYMREEIEALFAPTKAAYSSRSAFL